jgi:hypothetical protein
MVAPYEGAQIGPTIRQHLKHMPGWVWACGAECRCMRAIPLYPLIARYGLDITLPELRQRMRCATCQKPPESFSLPTFGRNGEHRFPPIDRVPESYKAYAGIDPTYLPAPLRGSP